MKESMTSSHSIEILPCLFRLTPTQYEKVNNTIVKILEFTKEHIRCQDARDYFNQGRRVKPIYYYLKPERLSVPIS